jgi:hypothetical protein
MMSNIQRKKFALNVRRDGLQPSIFVRSFGAITTTHLEAREEFGLPQFHSSLRGAVSSSSFVYNGLLTRAGRPLSGKWP